MELEKETVMNRVLQCSVLAYMRAVVPQERDPPSNEESLSRSRQQGRKGASEKRRLGPIEFEVAEGLAGGDV